MQILSVPATHHDMTCSVSMTGITQLKESKFKSRHKLPAGLVQTPLQGIITSKHYKQILPPITKPPKKKKKSQVSASSKSNHQVKIKSYRIDKKEVTHRIRQYVNQMKGEKMLYFWTITMPLNTADDTAFLLMNKWLTRLRQESMIREYLWITERQQNGTIHFHMVINHRMDVQKANRYMRASIMYSINENEIDWSREKAKNYNGVDIAKDRKTRRVINFAKKKKERALTNYLTKYITKNDSTFSHLAWHSSRGYSNLIISFRLTYQELQQFGLMEKVKTDKPLEDQYFTFYKWKGAPPDSILRYFSEVNQHIQSLLN